MVAQYLLRVKLATSAALASYAWTVMLPRRTSDDALWGRYATGGVVVLLGTPYAAHRLTPRVLYTTAHVVGGLCAVGYLVTETFETARVVSSVALATAALDVHRASTDHVAYFFAWHTTGVSLGGVVGTILSDRVRIETIVALHALLGAVCVCITERLPTTHGALVQPTLSAMARVVVGFVHVTLVQLFLRSDDAFAWPTFAFALPLGSAYVARRGEPPAETVACLHAIALIAALIAPQTCYLATVAATAAGFSYVQAASATRVVARGENVAALLAVGFVGRACGAGCARIFRLYLNERAQWMATLAIGEVVLLSLIAPCHARAHVLL